MSQDLQQQPTLPQEALIKPVRTVSKIWLVPIVALFIGIWMVYYQWSNQGPLITIQFKTATGLEAGKTKIKTRDVDIGLVKNIELTDDLSGVLVTVRMGKNVAAILHSDNQFWIVSPNVSLSGVSGLGTILSGPHINMVPGVEKQKSETFVALEAPPVTPKGTPGLHVTLNSESEFAYKKGDPVVYKGIKVGEFEDIFFNFEERVVYYNTFIEAPYHTLITTNTKFWDISGVQMELGASGVKVSTGSLETLLTNGVTFGIPEGMPKGEEVKDRSFFDIHPTHSSASGERYKLSVKYVIWVKDTVRGLQVGAPVEYRGLVIGKVISINSLENNQDGLLEQGYDIPVVISIQPGRVQQPDNNIGLTFIRKQTSLWIEKGLRATLKTGNLLTGALFVDLQHYPDAPPFASQHIHGYEVIPTMTGEFSEITAKVTAILDSINEMKLNVISENTNNMLLQIAQAAQSLQSTANTADGLISSMREENLSATLVDTLQNLSRLTKDYSADSETSDELNKTMQTLQSTLQQFQPLLLQLNNTPNSLIFNDGSGSRLIPKGKTLSNKEQGN
ncbi:intermembrane transport protein PqiB [Paraglaciecola sp. MB-3u-78]|jgi:paraquat-inducible protein B|uniref:intermembrane transport protein PqiB n=1 Tax=Paraglaciecola sp. MB-3u-78 TaxID=2058332 RepID=UPI000C33B395|nr:intermembrane transport protein PqiB [Paraglaciecola sp. MB-3u-78]PKG99031.1 paraquat-inducible protein B [Paraglaciecola sp. MB-3u-78]